MSRPAFRPAAVAAQGDRLLRTPGTDRLDGAVTQVLAMLAILLAVGVAVVFVPLPRTVAPEGIVTVSPGPVRLTAPRAGTVVDLLAEEGAEVTAGSVLMTLARPPEGLVAARALRERLARLREARALEAAEAHLRRESHDRQIALAEQRFGQVDALIARSAESVALMAAEAQRLSDLHDQGLALLASVAETQQDTIAARIALMTQENERVTMGAEIAGLEDTRAEIIAEWRAEDARLAAELAEVESQLALLDSPSVIEVAASISGTVEFVQSRPGQSVAEGSDLMVIAPPPVTWSADLYLTARQSAALRGLSDLTVALAAPDGREFRMDARMVAASTTPIPAGKVADTVKLTVSTDTPVYRARLRFEPDSAESAGLYVGQPLRIVAFLKAQSLFSRMTMQASSK